jgi:hypothetical protein
MNDSRIFSEILNSAGLHYFRGRGWMGIKKIVGNTTIPNDTVYGYNGMEACASIALGLQKADLNIVKLVCNDLIYHEYMPVSRKELGTVLVTISHAERTADDKSHEMHKEAVEDIARWKNRLLSLGIKAG